MSTAIPIHYLLSSYPNEKLISLESEQYQKLIDFSKIFVQKLNDLSISDFAYQYYRQLLHEISFEFDLIKDIMLDRHLSVPKREVAKYFIDVYNASVNNGFEWSRHK